MNIFKRLWHVWALLTGGAIVVVILAFFAVTNRPATPTVAMPPSASEEAYLEELHRDRDRAHRDVEQKIKQIFDEQKQQ
jgi:hypothetical protein